MDGFKSSPKMQCFKEGGAVKYKSRHSEKSEMSEDIAKDKKVVKKAFSMHDKQSHEGEKTNLSKLKDGGRMKKEGGCVGRYKAGGTIKTKVAKTKKAKAPSKAAIKPAMSNIAEPAPAMSPDMGMIPPPMMKKGGKTKKCAEGGSLKSVDTEENPGLAKLPTNVRNKMGYAKKGGEVKKYADGGMVGQGAISNVEKMRLANRAKNRAMLSPMQQKELDAQEAAAAAQKGAMGGGLSSMMGRMKKGGKAC